MAIRLIVGINAAPGKGSELAKLYKARCAAIVTEPGCEQFEVFQSVVNPDKLTILERWTDQEFNIREIESEPALKINLDAGVHRHDKLLTALGFWG